MAALLVVAYKVHGQVQQILIWIGINAVFTITFPGISWQGHLGGFVGGLAIATILVYAPRNNRTRWQVAGVSLVGLVVLIAIFARTVALTT
jgi:CDP-diglyceride synthetase